MALVHSLFIKKDSETMFVSIRFLSAKFISAKFSNAKPLSAMSLVAAALLLSACEERVPADTRAAVTLPVYTQGDADNGALIYEDACGQCHQLTPGLNKKGPQLLNIYGAEAAQLADYDYSDGLKASGWVWDAETLDPYIKDAEKAIENSKMLADPMPDASERADVIAYLSTLRAADPVAAIEAEADAETSDKANDKQHGKMSNEAIDISSDAAEKPAAHFQ